MPQSAIPDAGVTAADRAWLHRAVQLSRRCTPVSSAYSVGAVLISAGAVVAEGFSRETGDRVHAEESALRKVPRPARARLAGATLYTTLEPCTARATGPTSCTRLILEAGIGRVVLAMREPSHFVACEGVGVLTRAGVEVVELVELADEVLAVNAHLLGA